MESNTRVLDVLSSCTISRTTQAFYGFIHLQPWCVEALQASYRALIQNTIYTCSLLLEFWLSNGESHLRNTITNHATRRY